tara:strand:+ start:8615 stop:9019 length:405 start_codon:yes stop_codon:yes gene_type:complete
MKPNKILSKAITRSNPKLVIYQLLKYSNKQNAKKVLKYITTVSRLKSKFGTQFIETATLPRGHDPYIKYPRDIESGAGGDPDLVEFYKNDEKKQEKLLDYRLERALRRFVKFLENEKQILAAYTAVGADVGLPI